MKAPEIESWVDTVKQLIKSKWLVEVADLERGITVYGVTSLGLRADECTYSYTHLHVHD